MKTNHFISHLKKSSPNLSTSTKFDLIISDKDIKSLRHVTGGRVFLSLVQTGPRSQAAARLLTEETAGSGLCWCLHAISKAEDVISDENTLLADVRLALLKYRCVVFNHLNSAVFVHFDLR